MSSDIKIICFSKDRPMQLAAYLESLFLLTNFQEQDIFCVLSYREEYGKLISTYPSITWVKETNGFEHALIDSLSNIDSEFVLLGTDDFVYFKEVDKRYISTFFNVSDNVLGVSLRLGSNIKAQVCGNFEGNMGIIDWTKSSSHFGYPFCCSQACYRKELIVQVCEKHNGRIRLPNDLESFGFYFCNEQKRHVNLLGSFPTARGACLAVNRCQDIYENPTLGNADVSAESLLEKYRQGYKINVSKMANIAPPDCFIGQEYLELIK